MENPFNIIFFVIAAFLIVVGAFTIGWFLNGSYIATESIECVRAMNISGVDCEITGEGLAFGLVLGSALVLFGIVLIIVTVQEDKASVKK